MLSQSIFALNYQINGLREIDQALAGSTITLNIIDELDTLSIDSFSVTTYPSYAAKVSKNQLTFSNDFIGEALIEWKSKFGFHSQKLNIVKNIINTLTLQKLQIDTKVSLSFTTQSQTDSAFIWVDSQSELISGAKEENRTHLFSFDGIALDSVIINLDDPESIINVLVLETDSGWIRVDSTDYQKSQLILPRLENDMKIAILQGVKAQEIKAAINIVPQIFSPRVLNESNQLGSQITFTTPLKSNQLDIKIEIYNLDGQLIRQLVDESIELYSENIFEWNFNGLDEFGNEIRNGRYRLICRHRQSGSWKTIAQDLVVFR